MTTVVIANQNVPWGVRHVGRVVNESIKFCSIVGSGSHSLQKLSTDSLYVTTLTLDNIIVGSRYRVTRRSTGAELATGVAADTTVVITPFPVYEANMVVDIMIRNASGATKYKPFAAAATMTEDGASAYILQVED